MLNMSSAKLTFCAILLAALATAASAAPVVADQILQSSTLQARARTADDPMCAHSSRYDVAKC